MTTHGTRSTYQVGCRCELCRKANALYIAGYNARRADEDDTSDAAAQAEVRASRAYTRKQVAQLLGINPRTVTVGIAEGSIPSVKIGRRVLIPKQAFDQLFPEAHVIEGQRP